CGYTTPRPGLLVANYSRQWIAWASCASRFWAPWLSLKLERSQPGSDGLKPKRLPALPNSRIQCPRMTPIPVSAHFARQQSYTARSATPLALAWWPRIRLPRTLRCPTWRRLPLASPMTDNTLAQSHGYAGDLFRSTHL